MALGVNIVSALAGSFIGLVAGGVLAEWDWRSVFWVNIPLGVLGTVLLVIPGDFAYPVFAALIFVNGLGGGLFAAPNTSLVMSSVPAHMRGAASGMRATFQNAGQVLSIGVFFSLMVAGLASHLPTTLSSGLTAQGVPADTANQIAAAAPPRWRRSACWPGWPPRTSAAGCSPSRWSSRTSRSASRRWSPAWRPASSACTRPPWPAGPWSPLWVRPPCSPAGGTSEPPPLRSLFRLGPAWTTTRKSPTPQHMGRNDTRGTA